MKTTALRKPLAILIALSICLPSVIFLFLNQKAYAAAPMSAVLKDVFNLRADSKTSATLKAVLPAGQPVTILAMVVGENVAGYGYFWYNVSTVINGATITGYIIRDVAVQISDNTFEKQLSAFPASYHAGLIDLHSRHPNWNFTPLNTNYDWNHVLNNQEGKNALWYSYPVSQRSLSTGTVNGYGPSYYLLDDRYKVKDGTEGSSSYFYFASRQTIAHYMDPRNFLNDINVFMFENLGYRADQTVAGVEAILAGTFMSSARTPVVKYVDTNGNIQNTGKTYAQMILDAAVYSGASAYFIAARMRMELGVNGSQSVTGTFIFTNPDGTTINFSGYYNFFNVYASDSPDPGQNIANGLTYARDGVNYDQATMDKFKLPWTSPERSIMGGARYIAENYIRVGQDTLYLQKFSVNPATGKFCWHQYMSSVHAPKGESLSVYNSYNSMGILNNSIEFVIPVFAGMPASAVQASTETRSVNNLLTSLSLSAGTLDPGFAYTHTGIYTAYVDGVHANITLTGRKASLTSAVSTGATLRVSSAANVRDFAISIPLAVGENNFPLTITAANGAAQTYNLRIIRGIPPELDTPDLATLQVDGHSLSPAFDKNVTGPYKLDVPFGTGSVNISATPQSSLAVMSGAGTKTLAYGKNTFPITVTSPTNVNKTYIVEITRVVPVDKDNADLLTLSASGITLDRPFNKDDTAPYKATVDYSVASTTVQAAAKSEASVVTGTGVKTLNFGENNYTLTITSFSGVARTYNIQITRTAPELNRGGYSLTANSYLTGIKPGTTIQQIADSINAVGSETQVFRSDGTRLGASDLVGTGCTVRVVTLNIPISDDKVVIRGDLNGDGRINSIDITMGIRHSLGLSSLDTIQFVAADTNKDGRVNSIDFTISRRHTLGILVITQ